MKVNKDVLIAYERQKQNDLFSTVKKNTISDDTPTIVFHNLRSLSKHVDDVVNDDRIIYNDIIGLTETQINLSDSTCNIIATLNFFNIHFNKNQNKF